ncbi:hypothetical protein [Paenibacillus prosopidis]|uniref:hypothetical protein n=1 Tax=Paenibacillus prosopidis TaxID=630520 RepID=UPI0011C05B25|nr:hypothetical protein [Paenibacillus prosopidis]
MKDKTLVGDLEEEKDRACFAERYCSAGASLLSFSTSDIRAYFVSVILANHDEPLRTMVAYLFRERHPGYAGHTIALREPVMVNRGYDGFEIRMFCSFENSIRSTLASWRRFCSSSP